MAEEIIKVFCDGGSRGNPGKSACAFVVEENGKTIYSESKYLGMATNNVAEYAAVILALNWIKENKNSINSQIIFILDSELVVRQINKEYRVKNIELKKLHQEIESILKNIFSKIIFKNVSRENNKKADFLLNEKLDSLS